MGISDYIKKTSIANVVAGLAVIIGLAYGFYTNNTELIKYISISALGYLFGVSGKGGENA